MASEVASHPGERWSVSLRDEKEERPLARVGCVASGSYVQLQCSLSVFRGGAIHNTSLTPDEAREVAQDLMSAAKKAEEYRCPRTTPSPKS